MQIGIRYTGPEYTRLSQYVDGTSLLSYEMATTTGMPISAIDLHTIQQSLDNAITQIPPEKLEFLKLKKLRIFNPCVILSASEESPHSERSEESYITVRFFVTLRMMRFFACAKNDIFLLNF